MLLPSHDAYELYQQLKWHDNSKGAVVAQMLRWQSTTIGELDLRSTHQERNHTWYCKHGQLSAASEIIDLEGESVTVTV